MYRLMLSLQLDDKSLRCYFHILKCKGNYGVKNPAMRNCRCRRSLPAPCPGKEVDGLAPYGVIPKRASWIKLKKKEAMISLYRINDLAPG